MPAPTPRDDRYVDHLSAQQLARAEALHVSRNVLQSTRFMSSNAGAAPDGLIDVAEYIIAGVTETVRDMVAASVDEPDVDVITDEPPFT
ncbi:hypothetical protein SEA_ASHERTHEMAN_49 [Gordonia phage Ashertheman]|uniref:Uncharacterized protein n=1 Tax=Gordonia phage Ashertheman TaxID=2301692 RepID=A0A385DU16_9CAUD|nr:hypothetical protein J1764_gp49 [Gordonia phage Ashertheman]AXQ62956.1 hypothetical protein SEA_ASHERTHEMAN_49 [Gordonia phage Ashertheman]